MTIIYGAGIAGLLAANQFQRAKVFEAGSSDMAGHKAVLRFRSCAVGDSVGIDFRKVRVHKGLFDDGKFVQPSIQLANLYSKKVIGKLADRSVWNLDAVDRFIAPEDFITQLAERCSNRIEWNHAVTPEEFSAEQRKVISTLPMSVMVKIINAVDPQMVAQQTLPDFKHEGITVRRWRIAGADVFQTVYFPDPSTTLYRASITGDLLIAEYVGEADNFDFFEAFGLTFADCTPIEKVKQSFGKIAKIDDAWRKRFIFELSTRHDVYSLGRFGTWRNLLLDSVLEDIFVIKKLMNSSIYERSMHASK